MGDIGVKYPSRLGVAMAHVLLHGGPVAGIFLQVELDGNVPALVPGHSNDAGTSGSELLGLLAQLAGSGVPVVLTAWKQIRIGVVARCPQQR